MKQISILLLVFIILTSSCQEDFLDREPLGEVSPNSFFTSEKDLRLYLNSLYDGIVPTGSSIYTESVDNIVKSTVSEELTGRRIVPTSGGGWNWNNLRKINYFLTNYDRQGLSEEITRPYVGEARFFRAWFYFKKVKRFGDVPWYAEPLSVNDEELLTKARDSRTLVMDSVLADINFAVEHMTTNPSVDKATKWTALALKSRICLFEGTFRKYHPEFDLSDAEKFLQESADASAQLISESPYRIYMGEPEEVYLDLFASMDAIEDEVILARKYSAELAVYHNVNSYARQGDKAGLEKSFVNTYLMKNGSRFTDLPDFAQMEFYEETQNRDPRLAQTIRTPGYTRIGENEPVLPQFGQSITGYQLAKFVTGVENDPYDRSHNDIPVFRYAEVLLNYAEAKAELGTLTQDDLDLSLNLLRARVDMPFLNLADANNNPDPYLMDMYTHLSGKNTGVLLEIIRERGIELVMEGFRWDDLLRWKEGKLLTRQFYGMYFPGLGEYDLDHDGTIDVVLYEGDQPADQNLQYLKLGSDIELENGANGGRVLINPHISKTWDETKDYFYPIPIQEIELNPELVQNPNW
ncbi:hypothetical protein OKW21_004173 [Catalinimonas alkaloidigena]|uniref:RagB/SusD family nutrient uptake outer membrane protein n=1 Tax=Catalinimonas alkaloidigena TaxID=1075417 RepID=UPI002405651C|nr:RagB/SusD family nutrient uptake outer membrane protein [Catalinimonas alkaloidigena]MDF9798910.1 hypothetical protein [Catalinimonas alkaloidigena]